MSKDISEVLLGKVIEYNFYISHAKRMLAIAIEEQGQKDTNQKLQKNVIL